MNYKVRIDDEILRVKIDGHNSIWMCRASREKPIDKKPGIYIPGTAGGIQQNLTNFWMPSRSRYAKAGAERRQMLESFGVVFDGEGFVKSCENVPFPLQ